MAAQSDSHAPPSPEIWFPNTMPRSGDLNLRAAVRPTGSASSPRTGPASIRYRGSKECGLWLPAQSSRSAIPPLLPANRYR